jgi:hypothetical protein
MYKKTIMIDLDSNWKVLEGNIAGKPGIVRINAGLQSVAGTAPYPEELIVTVTLKEPNESGMPGPEEVSVLGQFEDLLRSVLQEDLQSLLAVVMTTDGFRDFIFYTSDPMAAVKRMQASVAPSFADLQVDVNGQPDAEWKQFKRFIKY